MTKFQANILPNIINTACLNTIKETESDLGTVDTIDLMSSALPFIVERKNIINLALQEADLDRAAMYAHKTLGSIRVYGTEKLENLLNQLKDQQASAGNIHRLQADLSEEFDSVSSTISEWLVLHRKAS